MLRKWILGAGMGVVMSASASAAESTATVTSIVGATTVPGNTNLMTLGIPELPEDLSARVKQYLNARGAGLQDISEDGRTILMSTRFGNTSQLHVVEMPMGARTQITFEEEPTPNGSFVPGRTDMLIYQQDKGGGEFYQFYELNRRTGESRLLTDGKSRYSGLGFADTGELACYSSTARNGKDTDVYVANVGVWDDARRLTEDDGSWYPAGFSRDGRRLMVMQYRSIDDSDLHVVDVETSARVQLTPKDRRGSVGGAAFSHDDRFVYLITDTYSNFNELYRIDLGNPDAEPEPLTRAISWDVESLSVARDGSLVALSVNEDGMSRLYLLNPETKELEGIDLPAKGSIGSLGFARRESSVLTFSLDSAQSPSDIWQLDVRTREFTRWTRSEVGGLDTSTFIEPELVRYASTGGVVVPAFYYRPPNASADAKAPVIVIFHGGPESQSRPGYAGLIQLFVRDLGIAVLLPNVRGSSGYGKEFVNMDNGIKREQSLEDIGATLDWIASRPELDASRIGVQGGSYGGYMTLAAMTFYGDRVRAGVNVVGISNIVSFLENTQDYRRDLRRAEYGDERDPDVRKVLERISPLNHVERIQGALFVVQGKNDPRVPQSEAEQIVRAMQATDRDVWYLLGLNEGHGFARKENRDYFLIAMVAFLKEHLLDAD